MTLVVPAEQAAGPPTIGDAAGPSRRGDLVRAAGGFVAVVVVWELLARTVLAGTNVVAPPSAIVAAIVEHWSLYQRAARTTLGEAARGFLWGNAIAVALAAVVAVVPITERVVLRVSLVVYCLPLVALGPLLRVVYGPGDGPQVTLAALACSYTTLVPLLVGLRAVPQMWSELVASYGRGRWSALRTVRLRASVPYLFAGLQVAVPASILGAIVGEFTGADRGLGLLIINTLRGFRTEELWAVASIAALLAMAGYAAVGFIAHSLAIGQPAVLLVPPPTGRARSAAERWARTVLALAATIAIVVGLWVGLMAWFDLDPYFAKRPADVWAYLVSDPDAAANRRELWDALGETAVIAVPGFLAGLALGAGGASVFALSDAVRRTATPFAVALRCVPIVAISPLLVEAFGRGVTGTVTTVAIMTFFPTLVACSYGLRQAPGQVLDVFAVYDAGRLRTLGSAQLPAMVPAFFAAARIAVPATVLAATVAEWLATGTGIGNLMVLANANSNYGTLWACVVVLTTVSAVAYGAVAALERVVVARVAPEQLAW